MAKSDLGKKHLCPNCEKCFYDLKRDPAVCPKCGTEMEPPKRPRPRRGNNHGSNMKQTASTLPNIENNKGIEFNDDDEPQQVEGGDEQENVIDDTSDIGGVDNGISEAMEHIDKAVAD